MDVDGAAGEIGVEQGSFEAGRGPAQELAGLLALGPDRDADIAALQQGCDKLMAHWRRRYPDSIRALRYEDLAAKGYRPAWGVLRHAVGGALSDYWYDPSDFRVEHVTDSDYLNDEYPTGYHQRGPETAMQWGGDMPDHFRD